MEKSGMATLEERVAFLEGKLDEHSHMVNGVRDALVSLERRMDRRFEAIDRRFETIERRLAGLDQKLDRGLAEIEHKLDRRFGWLVGIQLTTLVAIVAALLAR